MKAGIITAGLILLVVSAGVVYWFLKTPEEFRNGVPDFAERSHEETKDKVEIQDTMVIDPNLTIGSDSSYKLN